MKHLIIESGDCLGKNLLIKGLCEHFHYDNVHIRHFGKPPSGISPENILQFQFAAFRQEAHLIEYLNDMNYYYDNVVIWNRSHLGEFVYSQMFRNIKRKTIQSKLLKFEKNYINCNETYLISLTADPSFFLKQDDGHSFSQNLEQKTHELELFKEVHELSLIKNKLLIKVDKNGLFRNKQEILDEVIKFINDGKE